MRELHYRDFVDDLDIDAFEEAIGFTPIEQRGEDDVGYCPDIWGLHKNGDTTGKFAIHRSKKVYNCWVCEGGSLLSLVMEMYDWDEDTAITWLHQFAHGDKRSDTEFLGDFLAQIQPKEKGAFTMPYFNERVLDRFSDDTSWFLTRGISQEVIESYNLRYAEVAMKPSPLKLRESGPEKDGPDYYGPSAIFPHYWRGKLVGWQHRWMEWEPARSKTPKWLAKYTNTKDFPATQTLYNYEQALHAGDPVLVCESVPTVLMLASLNVPAVSYFGGGIKEPQLKLLRRFQQGVILAPDNDSPGDLFLSEATHYLNDYVPVWHLPKVTVKKGADIGDLPRDRVPDFIEKAYLPSLI